MNIGGKNIELATKLQQHLAMKKGKEGAGISAAFVMDGELIAACTVGKCGKDGTLSDISDLYNVGQLQKYILLLLL
ncbi:hypothetical protein [Oceanirhabdus seepicola]|uniref:Uncharacterized protein n=1 Tax=Oceanirhabdus seepicola TaxID=2828781 RepID=A0A9J6NWS2_9CLOT|nr:hypothetical protein [Oceanirhabdus seepicola]MCM1988898.1 hypothetical protein [Oceanirhabdus seepicola]